MIFNTDTLTARPPQHSQNNSTSTTEVECAADGERGLGGAIAGSLAGAVNGHQVGHGLLGTLGGAILDSFTEDKLKAHHLKKKMKSHEQLVVQGQLCGCQAVYRPDCRYHYGGHSHGGGGGGFYGGFSESVSFGRKG